MCVSLGHTMVFFQNKKRAVVQSKMQPLSKLYTKVQNNIFFVVCAFLDSERKKNNAFLDGCAGGRHICKGNSLVIFSSRARIFFKVYKVMDQSGATFAMKVICVFAVFACDCLS